MKNKKTEKKCEKSLQTLKKSDIQQKKMFKNYFTSEHLKINKKCEADVGNILKKSDYPNPSSSSSKKNENIQTVKKNSKVNSLMQLFEKKVKSAPDISDQSEEIKTKWPGI